MEIDEQIKVVTYCETIGLPVFHIVNEGKRTPWGGHQLVAAGLRRGVPDLFIPKACGGYFGFFLEMKFGDNKPTEEQIRWHNTLRQQGYAVQIAWNFEQARGLIDKYTGWGVTQIR